MTYSSTLAVNRQRINGRTVRNNQAQSLWGRNQNTTGFQVNERALGPISNTIMLLVLACLLGLLYLTQVTKTNAHGYKINELQKQQTAAQSEHDELEIASARLQSLERVKNSTVAASMTSVTSAGTVQN